MAPTVIRSIKAASPVGVSSRRSESFLGPDVPVSMASGARRLHAQQGREPLGRTEPPTTCMPCLTHTITSRNRPGKEEKATALVLALYPPDLL